MCRCRRVLGWVEVGRMGGRGTVGLEYGWLRRGWEGCGEVVQVGQGMG